MTPTQIAKSSSGASIKLKMQTNCKSANVIYLITCTQCGKQCVGETKHALNERINGHRSDWTKRRLQRSPAAEHFHLQNHDFNSHVSLFCIEHDAQWSDDTRKARESYWIRRLNTIQPHGINKGDYNVKCLCQCVLAFDLCIMARLKITSLETFQSNMIKNTTKRYVDFNAVSWFSICR